MNNTRGSLIFYGIQSQIGNLKIPPGADAVTLTMKANGVAKLSASYGAITVHSSLVQDADGWRGLFSGVEVEKGEGDRKGGFCYAATYHDFQTVGGGVLCVKCGKPEPK